LNYKLSVGITCKYTLQSSTHEKNTYRNISKSKANRMACHTQEEIASALDCDKATISRTIDDLLQKGKLAES